MACDSCNGDGRFNAYKCDQCGRWHFQIETSDLLIAAGLIAVAAVIVLQPEILAPAGLLFARRVVAAFA
jgi:hypothetical protein